MSTMILQQLSRPAEPNRFSLPQSSPGPFVDSPSTACGPGQLYQPKRVSDFSVRHAALAPPVPVSRQTGSAVALRPTTSLVPWTLGFIESWFQPSNGWLGHPKLWLSPIFSSFKSKPATTSDTSAFNLSLGNRIGSFFGTHLAQGTRFLKLLKTPTASEELLTTTQEGRSLAEKLLLHRLLHRSEYRQLAESIQVSEDHETHQILEQSPEKQHEFLVAMARLFRAGKETAERRYKSSNHNTAFLAASLAKTSENSEDDDWRDLRGLVQGLVSHRQAKRVGLKTQDARSSYGALCAVLGAQALDDAGWEDAVSYGSPRVNEAEEITETPTLAQLQRASAALLKEKPLAPSFRAQLRANLESKFSEDRSLFFEVFVKSRAIQRLSIASPS